MSGCAHRDPYPSYDAPDRREWSPVPSEPMMSASEVKTMTRRTILSSLQTIDGAIYTVQAQALPGGDPEARATFQDELIALLSEKCRLQSELLKV
jgi:hypothetical protein